MEVIAALISIVLMTTMMSSRSLGVEEAPYLYLTWKVTYGPVSGLKDNAILINGEFPGPNINATTNTNVVVNIFNNMEFPVLFTWSGIQQRRNCWQDGTLGTNCPILPINNYTYHFQLKDQIGTFFYYPSIGLQRADGGYGGLRINDHRLPVSDDFTLLIGDWYDKPHKQLQKRLNQGKPIGRPFMVLINGKNTQSLDSPLFEMAPEKTYRFRVCNVGIRTSLNLRLQGHSMKLVEIDGSYVVQNEYDSLDIHVGQCYSVLVTANNKIGFYYIIASTRFTKKYLYMTTAVIKYVGSDPKKTPPSPILPDPPTTVLWSINQTSTFKLNCTDNPACLHYSGINIARTIVLQNSVENVDGKLRYAINGKSFEYPDTPLKLSEYFGIVDEVFKYNTIEDQPSSDNTTDVVIGPIVVKNKYRDFIEIVFQNPERSIQSYHLDGYSFFVVGYVRNHVHVLNFTSYDL